jgi:transcriptional regulator with XRE-family HTH domain
MKNYAYNCKTLTRKRRALKLTLEDVSTQLTLSITQIKSLENDRSDGFVTPYFKYLSLKRYAMLLEIDLDKFFQKENESDTLQLNEIPANEKHTVWLKKILHTKTYIFLFLLFLILLIFYFSNNFNQNTIKIETNLNQNESIQVDPNSTSTDNQTIENNTIQNTFNTNSAIKKSLDESSSANIIEFLCTIRSSPTIKFSINNPERPPTYFHIISHQKQSFCTVDANGQLRQYEMKAGDKLTHRGQAPFKIQFNPEISTLYFQGWKVHTQAEDLFIQLIPTLFSSEFD